MDAEQTLRQFVEDCEDAGFEVIPYHGRSFYYGFAVAAGLGGDGPMPEDVARATSCPLQRDSLGRGLIIYPRASLRSREALTALAAELGLDKRDEDDE